VVGGVVLGSDWGCLGVLGLGVLGGAKGVLEGVGGWFGGAKGCWWLVWWC
jgi:hypothetical protein